MFDLPTETIEDRKNYRRFHKFLITNGFYMMQESVYTRLLITPTASAAVVSTLKKGKPPKGLVQVLTVTEKQFASMETISGENHTDVLNTDERIVFL